MELGINLPMAGIETSITDHFEMLFWYVPDQSLNEFHGRNRFFYVLFVFMSVVMESNHFAIVFINSGCSDDRTPQISTDIFDNCFGVTFVRFGINVKTVLMLRIAIRFHFFERRTDFGLHFIKQSSAESIT